MSKDKDRTDWPGREEQLREVKQILRAVCKGETDCNPFNMFGQVRTRKDGEKVEK